MKLKVIYEDGNILIIDKPAGLMVHPDGINEEETLTDIIRRDFSFLVGVGEDIDRPGIVHRLDKETSGVLILCKTQGIFEDVKNNFKNHKIKKTYLAIVEGNVRDDTGIITKSIARSRSDFRKKNVVDIKNPDHRGEERDALTKYKVLERSNSKKYTLIQCYPETGRTHQIRVHLRSIRHSIIGDKLYGTSMGSMLAGRHMLHANKIEFSLRGNKIKAESSMPEDMIEVWNKLKQ